MNVVSENNIGFLNIQCPHCTKVYKRQSGLVNHLKKCKANIPEESSKGIDTPASAELETRNDEKEYESNEGTENTENTKSTESTENTESTYDELERRMQKKIHVFSNFLEVYKQFDMNLFNIDDMDEKEKEVMKKFEKIGNNMKKALIYYISNNSDIEIEPVYPMAQ